VSAQATRAALVGCGRIAGAHVSALRAAGVEVTSVTGREGSERAPAFAAEQGIRRVHRSIDELAADDGWDVAVVAITPAAGPAAVAALGPTGRPILLEKPGATSPAELEALRPWADQLLLGYNRRFYAPVRRAAALLAERGPALVEVVLPESVPEPGDAAAARDRLLTNGTHLTDLLLHLLGPIDVVGTAPVAAGHATPATSALGTTPRGDAVQLALAWDSPDNARVTIHWQGSRYELKPIERGRELRGMDVVEPTPGLPLRSYEPIVVAEVVADATEKPGFAEQAAALAARAQGRDPGPAARLDDGIAALRLAEALLPA
jgi:predicted dehydrogenase